MGGAAMIVSEKEAGSKWCPMMQAPSGTLTRRTATPGGALDIAPHPWACCIGSQCMLWEWEAHAGTTVTMGENDAATMQKRHPGRFDDAGTGLPVGMTPLGPPRRVLVYRESVGLCGMARHD